MKAVVVGGGFGGLACAIRLQARGITTTLCERRDKLGGRAYVYEADGFKFDGGPTVVTAPYLFEEIFEAAGKRMADYVSLMPLDPFYRIYFHDNSFFDYSGDTAKQEEQIRKINPDDVAGYHRFMTDTRRIFQKGLIELGGTPFLKLWDMAKVAPDLIRLNALRSVYSFASGYFKSEKLRRVFSFHPLLVGGSPFRSPAIYTLIHTLEKDFGVHYAMGGTGAIVQGMAKLFQELGGKIELNATVTSIDSQNKRVKRVFLENGKSLDCDLLVSNADLVNTYSKLLPQSERKFYSDKKVKSYSQSMSVVVIYFGVKGKLDGLLHHNIILTERYRDLINDIFKKKLLAEDFSLYWHIPSKSDSSVAPVGHEASYVLCPVPNFQTENPVDWEKVGPEFENRILEHLQARFAPDLMKRIVVRKSINPLHFEKDLLSYRGNAFGVEPILTQSAFFRPHNRSQDISNLYLVGANTQPGAGMPGVLLSAKITDALIASDFQL